MAAWIFVRNVFPRSYWQAADIREEQADLLGVSIREVRVSLTGKRSVRYRSQNTGKQVRFAAWRRWPDVTTRETYRQWKVERRAKKPEPPPKPEEWEVTISYASAKKLVDITVRITPDHPSTELTIRKAFWRALHGHEVDGFDIHAIDWRTDAGDFEYPTKLIPVETALDSMRPIARTVGYWQLRVARVEA